MTTSRVSWDAELYEARHSFVWQYGEALIALLDPRLGERILDLGCGTGHLTAAIAARGAEVLGIDNSPAMIGQARQNYPALAFRLENAATMTYENQFDAVFSNAALHWMLDASAVAGNTVRALRPGGRFVLEMGGRGNVQIIESAVIAAVERRAEIAPERRTFFPTIGEYASLLEGYGLEVQTAELFDRPTPLEGDAGLADWIRQFKYYHFETLPPRQREEAMAEVIAALRPKLFRNGQWLADYRRLRLRAIKPGPSA